jgi:hypothetical protein
MPAASTPRQAVLLDARLLGHILRFLGGSSREARADLGRGALVCHAWKDEVFDDAVWQDMAGELFPCLRDCAAQRGGSRAYVVEHGRALLERRRWAEGQRSLGGLRMHFEVWDESDGLRLLSAEGPMAFDTLDDSLIIVGEGSRTVAPPFSAASRDPRSLRFTSIADYFERAHETDLPSGLHVRVAVRDERTGRQALLWSSGETPALRAEDRGEGDYCIYPLDEFPVLLSPSWPEVPLGGHFWFGLSMASGGQVGSSEQDQMYTCGDVCRFYFDTSDSRRVCRFLWSLLSG